MKLSEYLFAMILVASSVMIIYGISLVSDSAAWVTTGVLTAALGWLTLSETK